MVFVENPDDCISLMNKIAQPVAQIVTRKRKQMHEISFSEVHLLIASGTFLFWLDGHAEEMKDVWGRITNLELSVKHLCIFEGCMDDRQSIRTPEAVREMVVRLVGQMPNLRMLRLWSTDRDVLGSALRDRTLEEVDVRLKKRVEHFDFVMRSLPAARDVRFYIKTDTTVHDGLYLREIDGYLRRCPLSNLRVQFHGSLVPDPFFSWGDLGNIERAVPIAEKFGELNVHVSRDFSVFAMQALFDNMSSMKSVDDFVLDCPRPSADALWSVAPNLACCTVHNMRFETCINDAGIAMLATVVEQMHRLQFLDVSPSPCREPVEQLLVAAIKRMREKGRAVVCWTSRGIYE